jgi:hypothetical protein
MGTEIPVALKIVAHGYGLERGAVLTFDQRTKTLRLAKQGSGIAEWHAIPFLQRRADLYILAEMLADIWGGLEVRNIPEGSSGLWQVRFD